jgi:pimeloyl-ACP methyl ester carboxylesterase
MVQLSFPSANRDPAVFPDAGRVVIDRSRPSHLSKMITSRTDRMPYANVNGQRLYYEDTGGTGPAIIFSHGILLDGTMFAPQVAALRDKYRCIVWDERGHGKTAGETLRPFSYYHSANDLAALLAFLGVSSAILAGMSQGGFLGMRWAVVHPERVRALILFATQTGTDDPQRSRATTRRLMRGLRTNYRKNRQDAGARHFRPRLARRRAWKEKWRTMTAPNLLGAFETLARRDDIGDKVSAIRVPTLIIHGDADAPIPLAKAHAMQSSIPNAELVVVEGSHPINMTNPAPVNAAIEAFLARHRLVS